MTGKDTPGQRQLFVHKVIRSILRQLGPGEHGAMCRTMNRTRDRFPRSLTPVSIMLGFFFLAFAKPRTTSQKDTNEPRMEPKIKFWEQMKTQDLHQHPWCRSVPIIFSTRIHSTCISRRQPRSLRKVFSLVIIVQPVWRLMEEGTHNRTKDS